MDISHHCVAVPAGRDFDDVRVASTDQERHSPACLQGAGGEVHWFDSGGGFEHSGVPSDGFCDLCGFNRHMDIMVVVIRRQYHSLVIRYVFAFKVPSMKQYLAYVTGDRATKGIAATCVRYFIAFVAIFSSSECEMHRCGGLDLMVGGAFVTQTARSQEERYVVQRKGLIIGCRPDVFSRSQTVEERKGDQVRYCLAFGGQV